MNAPALRRTYEFRQPPEPQWPARPGVSNQFSPAASEPVAYQRAEVSLPSTATKPKWIEPVIARMGQLVDLKNNWDQRGSAEVSIDALRYAANILSRTMPPTAPPPSIVPLGHGGVQLLWHNDKADLEIEVLRPNEIVVYHLNKSTGDEVEEPLTTDLSSIVDYLWSDFKD
jgi:hypothetical protein